MTVRYALIAFPHKDAQIASQGYHYLFQALTLLQNFNTLCGGIIMDITTTNKDNATILSIAGRVDTATAPLLEQAINKEIDAGHRQVLLNFSGVSYISSGGLRVLLATAKKLKTPGDKFSICSLSPEVLKILKLAGFTSIFSIYPSEAESLAGW